MVSFARIKPQCRQIAGDKSANPRMIRRQSAGGVLRDRGRYRAKQKFAQGGEMRSFEPGHQLCSPPGPVARMVWPLVMALPVVLSGCASIVIHARPGWRGTGQETSRMGDHVLPRCCPEGVAVRPERRILATA